MSQLHSCTVALEQTTKATAERQLACRLCSCVRGNNSPYHQLAVMPLIKLVFSKELQEANHTLKLYFSCPDDNTEDTPELIHVHVHVRIRIRIRKPLMSRRREICLSQQRQNITKTETYYKNRF